MTNERKGMWSLDDRLIKGGYGADENIPSDYRARIENDPEWQKDIDNFVSLIPERLNLSSGSINLSQAEVLDIGAGPGIMTDKIVDRVRKVIAVDLEENMTHDIKDRYAGNEKVNVARGSFLEIPLADNSVDLALSSGTIWHIPVEKNGPGGEKMTATEIEDLFLSESLRVLRPGGVYILNGVWNGNDKSVSRDFDSKRQDEISSLIGKNLPMIYRKFVISSKDLEERLSNLGYKCLVEMPECDENTKNCNARITLLEKTKK